MAHDISKSTLDLINEYALWIAAGISPSLLGTDVPSSAAPASNSCPPEAKAAGVTVLLTEPVSESIKAIAAIRKTWMHNHEYIRIDSAPIEVELDYDGTVRHGLIVHGECPACVASGEADTATFTLDSAAELITCSCGASWPLEYGTPDEFKPFCQEVR